VIVGFPFPICTTVPNALCIAIRWCNSVNLAGIVFSFLLVRCAVLGRFLVVRNLHSFRVLVSIFVPFALSVVVSNFGRFRSLVLSNLSSYCLCSWVSPNLLVVRLGRSSFPLLIPLTFFFVGNKLLRLRKEVRLKLQEIAAEDDDLSEAFVSLVEKQAKEQALLAKQRSLLARKRRRLEERYLALHSEQAEMTERELKSIEELEKLEEASSAGASGDASVVSLEPVVSSAVVLDPCPSEFLLDGLPPNWSFSQILGSGDGTSLPSIDSS
jgi:hypothetical protein